MTKAKSWSPRSSTTSARIVRGYFTRPDDLEPGQLIYWCPDATERARKGKTMAHTHLVPVRLSVVAQEDIDALIAGAGALERREIRVRRLVARSA